MVCAFVVRLKHRDIVWNDDICVEENYIIDSQCVWDRLPLCDLNFAQLAGYISWTINMKGFVFQ